MDTRLTVHMVVKNEPFIYYSVKAVYEEADEILLYDTGSYDENTIGDIETILKEDTDNKIRFKQLSIGATGKDKWNVTKLPSDRRELAGADGVGIGLVRQMQIDDTKTEYFLVVDGDEVHFKGTITKIKENCLDKMVGHVVCGRIPLYWFCSENEIFSPKGKGRILDSTGRIFKTDSVYVNVNEFPEEHYLKGSIRRTGKLGSPYNIIFNLPPFYHYEAYLKPWRRDLYPYRQLVDFPLPEVVIENTYYFERYKMEVVKNGDS